MNVTSAILPMNSGRESSVRKGDAERKRVKPTQLVRQTAKRLVPGCAKFRENHF